MRCQRKVLTLPEDLRVGFLTEMIPDPDMTSCPGNNGVRKTSRNKER